MRGRARCAQAGQCPLSVPWKRFLRCRLMQVCHPVCRVARMEQLRQFCQLALPAAASGKLCSQDLQKNHPLRKRLVLPRTCCWQQAGQGVVRHRAHAGRELPRRLAGPANGAGKLAQGETAGRALALLVRVLLRQLGSREGLLDLGHLAAAALDALPRGGLGVEAPLPRSLAVLVLSLAGQAGGRKVGPDLFPLRVRKQVQAPPLAAGFGPARLAEGVPVDVLAS